MPRFLLLGNPENERVARFQDALAGLGLPPAEVLPWAVFLENPRALETALRPDVVLRIDSPGENLEVERLLLGLGADEPDEQFEPPRVSADAARALPRDHGRLRFPRQFHLGFAAALRVVRSILAATPHAAVMNDPLDLEAMADKPTSDRLLRAAGARRPRLLGFPRSYEELGAVMASADCRRVFIKLANGSSASGVVAYRTDGRRHVAMTSAEIVRDGGAIRLYNSKRIREYRSFADVRDLFDCLCPEGVLVEEWIPKAALRGRPFDLRVVVIAGAACHVAVRSSPAPLTNLHLGRENRREEPSAVIGKIGESAWRGALAAAERALEAFSTSLYAGVDVIVASGLHRPYIAEVNGFGDLLRRTYHRNRDPHAAEVEALLAAGSQPAGASRD